MSRTEDTGSRTEHDAERAEHHRAIAASEDTDPRDEFTTRSTWTPANVPQRILDEVAAAPTDVPPFT